VKKRFEWFFPFLLQGKKNGNRHFSEKKKKKRNEEKKKGNWEGTVLCTEGWG
jgi:hypothetical protein